MKTKKSKELSPNEIKIIKETPVKYVNLDVEFGSNVFSMLLEYAKANILNDEQALINWAFINAIEKGIAASKKGQNSDKIPVAKKAKK